MNNKAAITSTIGYMCLALTGWMLSMPNAAWFDVAHGHGTAMLYPMAMVLIVMGILSFVNERTLDAIIFFGGAGLFWAGHQYLIGVAVAGSDEPARYSAGTGSSGRSFFSTCGSVRSAPASYGRSFS